MLYNDFFCKVKPMILSVGDALPSLNFPISLVHDGGPRCLERAFSSIWVLGVCVCVCEHEPVQMMKQG